jgi:type II secretory pathway component GspD/PulD (secretin)
VRTLICIVLAGSLAFAANTPGPVANGATRRITPQEQKEARRAFTQGVKLRAAGKTEEAYDLLQRAARLDPSPEYLTAREVARQQLVYDHLQLGNNQMLAGQQVKALAEFRSALNLDPDNQFAQQRLRDALSEWAPEVGKAQARVLAQAGSIQVQPQGGRRDFRFRGDSRTLLQQVASAFGMTLTMDDSVVSRRVRFDIDNVDFPTAMQAAGEVTHTFWAPLSEKQMVVAADTPQNHRLFDRMALRTIYLPNVSSPQQLNDVVNLLRVLFDIRFVSQQQATSTITVRAPQEVLEAATRLLEGLDEQRPQVLLDIKLYQVSHTLMRAMGLNIPAQFKMFNIPAGALTALGGQNIQQLINQLISSGGINAVNSQALAGLLAQLQNQFSGIFSQPFATFGGGLTLMGLTIPSVSANFSDSQSSVSTLQHVTLHASQSDPATLRMGERFPILNASFAPIFNTAALSQVIANGSFQAPFPSFSYEDLGLTMKATPAIHGLSSVTLNLELQLRSLLGQSINGVPVIAQREYKGTITLQNGEPGVVAGSVSTTDQRSLSGIPGLAQIPGVNKVTGSNNKQLEDDELLVVITPHILSSPVSGGAEVWLPPGR